MPVSESIMPIRYQLYSIPVNGNLFLGTVGRAIVVVTSFITDVEVVLARTVVVEPSCVVDVVGATVVLVVGATVVLVAPATVVLVAPGAVELVEHGAVEHVVLGVVTCVVVVGSCVVVDLSVSGTLNSTLINAFLVCVT